MARPEPELTIVVPAYNEAALIESTVEAIAEFIRNRSLSAEVLVVDDGSTDGTGNLARQAMERLGLNGRVIRQEPNAGKGVAVRRGMLEASGRLILMTDADLSTPLEEYDKLAQAIADGADVAIASRAVRGARLEPPQPWWRQTLGQLYALVRRIIVLPHLMDTQCGFKLWKREPAREAFSRQTITRWAFDAEVLYIADRLGYRIAEVPVVWRNRRESKVRVVRDAPSVLRDLLAIRRRHRKLTRTDRAQSEDHFPGA
ncbi:MAG: glycosyltransferase family 2 protein [Armatimonadetes bacterium]|nr:glycosyltransferase family 2 protein [Armatimonadota bacterium]